MIEPNASDHRAAFALRGAAAVVFGVLALWALLALVAGVRDAVASRTSWVSVEGVNGGWGGENLLEIELRPEDAAKLPPLPQPTNPTIYQPGHVRVLVPDPVYAWHNLAGPVTLALRPGTPGERGLPGLPGRPGEVIVVDLLTDVLTGLSRAFWVAVLGALAWLFLYRIDWGRDLTWDGAGWAAAAMTAWPPGARAVEPQQFGESGSRRKWLLVLSAVAGVLVLAGLAEAAFEGQLLAQPPGIGMTLLIGLGGLGLYFLVLARTRRVQWDDVGVADSSWFGTRRLPWSAIARWQRENTSQAAQERYDRQSLSRRKGSRPRDHWVWMAYSATGAALLKLEESMEPAEALQALRQRVERLTGLQPPARAAVPFGEHGDDDGGVDEDEDEDLDVPASAAQQAAWQQAQARHEAFHASVDRGFRMGYWFVVAPFVLLFGATVWSAMKYQFAADRVEGTVIATEADTEVPSLTVRYPGPDGRPLELRTDGTRSNQGIAVGTKVMVLRPPSDPEDAKTADFWSVWIWPVITGVLLLIVAVPFYLGFVLLPKRDAQRRARLRPSR